jgi:dihydrofolate reductase
MRKLILQMQMTVDGFVGRLDGDVEWAFPTFDDAFNAWTVNSLWQAGVHVMGSVTGQGLAEYWPSPTLDERDKPFAEAMNQIPKVVFSRSIDHLDWNKTRIAKGELVEEIERLKAEPGKDILVHGGARFAQSLSKARLIDEYHLVTHPVVLGSGLSIFPELDESLRLALVEARAFPAGAVLHIYRRA